MPLKIALCGNPNVGKTTLYNRITRSDAPVGNWHGVTVDVKSKRVGNSAILSDLPGAYSLTARTAEECITRDAVLYGGYDVFVYVAEVNNLRRNMYMFLQLLEADKRVVLVVNMMDEARGKVDLGLLSKRLGVPVVGASFKNKNPKSEILAAAELAVIKPPIKPSYLSDGRIVAAADKIKNKAASVSLDARFAALKAAERDPDVLKRLGADCDSDCGNCSFCMSADRDEPAMLRYKYIDELLHGVVYKPEINALTERIDKVILGKAALPIFLAVMAAVFVITFEAGRPLSDLLVSLTEMLKSPINKTTLPDWARSLMADGIISGVGGVLAFLPQVVILYLLTALLQDSGYMSRVAFVTDDFFKKFGLSGRAAFSVVLGLGCSASAVLSTRGIANKKARSRAAFITPFCPCSARLAVFTAIAGYFGLSGLVVAAMYVLGFAMALIVLKIMSFIDPDSGEESMIMEMPPYRLPGIGRVLKFVLANVWSFIVRVGTTVLAVSVIMWALCNFSVSQGFTGGLDRSIMSTVSGIIAPIFAPLGFGSWRAVTALLSGVAAKETVISVIAALGGMTEVFESVHAAISFMIFTCLYIPCAATLSAIAKENGAKSAVLSVTVHTVTAYVVALVYYQSAMSIITGKYVYVITMAAAFTIFVFALCAIRIRRKRKNRTA